MAVNWKAGGGARDAGDGCFRFGNGIGEKKQRINEMAAYYLARAVVFFFFLPIELSVLVIKHVCRVHTV